MKHFSTPEFWDIYDRLPARIRKLADKNFSILKSNPLHPSLHFKNVGRFWSARVGIDYRAVCVRDGDECIWFWIGPHAEYNSLIK